MNTHACGPRLNHRYQTGVGLIEVLVAVLVVSVGFLGVAALQVTSLSTNNSAMARSMATVSSYSILDAMRIDRTDALQGAYNGTVTANKCPVVGDSLASVQLNQWCQQLGHNLGEADTTTGKIACVQVGATGGTCSVTISFDDNRSDVGGGVDANGLTTVITKAAL